METCQSVQRESESLLRHKNILNLFKEILVDVRQSYSRTCIAVLNTILLELDLCFPEHKRRILKIDCNQTVLVTTDFHWGDKRNTKITYFMLHRRKKVTGLERLELLFFWLWVLASYLFNTIDRINVIDVVIHMMSMRSPVDRSVSCARSRTRCPLLRLLAT